MMVDRNAALRACLGSPAKDITVIYHEELDSTNAEARRLAQSGQGSPVLIVAGRQTAGRGRMGRSFFSPAGAGIYMTYLWQPYAAAVDVVSTTTAVAVAVHRALCTVPGVDADALGIKWVNDIYYHGKKVCGILTEAITDPSTGQVTQMWVGIGVNVAPSAFPAELESIATSLGTDESDHAEMIATIMRELLPLLHGTYSQEHMDYYRAHSIVVGRTVDLIHMEKMTPVYVSDIDSTGGLVVRCPDGTYETVHSGEVSLRLTE